MIVSKEEIEFIRLLQNLGIHFCTDCHAKTQGTYLNINNPDEFVYVIGCTKCKWGTSLETKSISNR
jgi:hypothetical protein